MKNILIASGLLIFALGLALITGWRAKNWQIDYDGQPFSQIKKIEIIPPENLYPQSSENGYKEFVSPDGGLKLKYPAAWMPIEDENVLSGILPNNLAEKYNLKTLFIAQNLRDEKFAQITVFGGRFNMSVKEIIDELSKINQEQKWQTKLNEIKIGEKEGVFEGEYKNQANVFLYSLEKILIAQNGESYLISFTAAKNDWSRYSREADSIINSALLTNQ